MAVVEIVSLFVANMYLANAFCILCDYVVQTNNDITLKFTEGSWHSLSAMYDSWACNSRVMRMRMRKVNGYLHIIAMCKMWTTNRSRTANDCIFLFSARQHCSNICNSIVIVRWQYMRAADTIKCDLCQLKTIFCICWRETISMAMVKYGAIVVQRESSNAWMPNAHLAGVS